MHLRGAVCVIVMNALAVAGAFAASPQEIQKTIEKSKSWLYSQQLPDGTWEIPFDSRGDQKTGQTALVVYALLSSGESHQDKKLTRAIEYLKKTETTGVYALGVRCQVWNQLPATPDVRAAAMKDAKILTSSMMRTGEARGFYNYNPGGKVYSHSRAQYAVLGLWAATQVGIDVPKEYWSIVEKAWIDHQDPSGAWAYYAKPRSDYPLTAGMTAAGVATLFITQDFVHATDGLECKGNIRNASINRGMQWLSDNFSRIASDEKSSGREYPLATLYAIERVGVASGYKYIGTNDWYAKGSDYLISKQKSDGYFTTEYGVKTAGTCFALLFLSRGSSPIAFNKLDYSAAKVVEEKAKSAKPQADDSLHWNQRPRDAANAARWISKQIERDVNWQIVNLDSTVDDFHDAPILYLSGNQSIAFPSEQQAKIKQFIQEGGMLVASADCAASGFVNSVRQFGKTIFPEYEFCALPENHVIFTGEQFKRASWKRKPNVISMSNGVRELMMILPDCDAGKFWQTQASAARPELFELAADVLLYATEKREFRRRGETYVVKRDEKITASKTIKIARLEIGDNWDPEPAGWKRLAAIMHNANKIDVVVEAVKPQAGSLTGYKIAHLTGTDAVKFDPAARTEIKSFLTNGGTLVIDAVGGSTAFAGSIEAELKLMFPDAASPIAQPIPADHALYSAGGKLGHINYRAFSRAKLGAIDTPQLRGITIDNRLAIIFSREDLSAGLVGESIDGITGYDPATATSLMTKILLYASHD